MQLFEIFKPFIVALIIANLCGLLAFSFIYQSTSPWVMSLRNMCEPKLFFQSTPFDEVPKSGLMVFFFLAVTSFLDIYILSDPISIFSYCKTIAPIGLMVLMPINYWRYDIGRLFEFRRQIDPRLEEGKLNLRIYFVEAIVILLCGLTFTIIFDCIVFLQRALIG